MLKTATVSSFETSISIKFETPTTLSPFKIRNRNSQHDVPLSAAVHLFLTNINANSQNNNIFAIMFCAYLVVFGFSWFIILLICQKMLIYKRRNRLLTNLVIQNENVYMTVHASSTDQTLKSFLEKSELMFRIEKERKKTKKIRTSTKQTPRQHQNNDTEPLQTSHSLTSFDTSRNSQTLNASIRRPTVSMTSTLPRTPKTKTTHSSTLPRTITTDPTTISTFSNTPNLAPPPPAKTSQLSTFKSNWS